MAIWPFGRRRNADEPATEPAAADSASPSPGEADVARPERTPTGDWMTLPPVSTAMATPMPTTFRVQRLPEILTSHQDSRLSGSLGHAVSAEAPSGTIGGLAAAAGTVHHEGTASAAELREPHRAPAPEAPMAPLVQRRLATTADAAPLTSSGTTSANLPEPAVSRVLANPAPLPPSPPQGAAPLPVARVVDAPAAPSAAPASAVLPAPPADAAPLTGDSRVGGFEVPLEELLSAPEPATELLGAPTGELAPPIQPRRIQRKAAPHVQTLPDGGAAGPTSSAPPATSTAPLVGDGAGATSPPLSPSTGTVTAGGSAGPGALPLVEPGGTGVGERPGEADVPVARIADDRGGATPATASPPGAATDAATSPGAPSGSTASGHDLGATTSAAPLVGGAGPLSGAGQGSPDAGSGGAAPSAGPDLAMPLQRKATVESASPRDARRPDAAAASGAPGTSPEVQRSTAPPTSASSTRPAATAAPSSAPLIGDAADLIASTRHDEPAPPATRPAAGSTELPLVEPPGPASTAAAAGSVGGDGPEAQVAGVDAEAPGAEPMSSVAPTLGHSDPLGVQRIADNGLGQHQADPAPGGAASLPLAPTLDTAPGLQPPAPSSAGPTAAASRSLPVASTSSAPAVQRRTEGASTSPLALVRPLAGATSATAASLGGISTLGVQRVAGTDGTGGAAAGAGAPSTGARPVDPVLVRRLPGGDGLPSGVVTPESLTPLQRALDAPSTATPSPAATREPLPLGSSSPAAGSLPLHTPAASVPSAADVAVKAGFAERGPNGNLFYTSPPGGGSVVQRAVDAPAEATAPASGDQLTIQPVASDEGSSSAPPGAPAAEPSRADLVKQARSLYPFIRNALESDLRRELEGKHRPNRFRP